MDETMNAGTGNAVSAVFCGHCGHKNFANFKFCQSCGQGGALAAASEVISSGEEVAGPEKETTFTLSKATLHYAGGLALNAACLWMVPELFLIPYLCAGYWMTRVVMRQLIEWHPNYNTLDNVVSAKLKMFALWPFQMAGLLLKLSFNKAL